jgi:SAM-dependent methyltransferase
MAEVDLERLAGAYEHRPDRGGRARVTAAVAAAQLAEGDLVVDIGGGRGRHAGAFADLGCRPVVVDPSRRMAAAAWSRGIPAVVAVGEDVPIADEVADLVYFHLSIHHGDWHRMLREAWRVVRPDGFVFVWTMEPAYHRRSFLSRWFPRVGEIDAGRFPDAAELAAAFESFGGEPAGGIQVDEVERRAGDWIEAVRAGFVSTLHLLSDDEISEGLERFTAAHPDPDERIRYRLEHTSVWSVRPSVES